MFTINVGDRSFSSVKPRHPLLQCGRTRNGLRSGGLLARRARYPGVMTSPIIVQKFLKGADYPADRNDLVALAEGNDAPEEVIEALGALEETTFDGPDEVVEALDV